MCTLDVKYIFDINLDSFSRPFFCPGCYFVALFHLGVIQKHKTAVAQLVLLCRSPAWNSRAFILRIAVEPSSKACSCALIPGPWEFRAQLIRCFRSGQDQSEKSWRRTQRGGLGHFIALCSTANTFGITFGLLPSEPVQRIYPHPRRGMLTKMLEELSQRKHVWLVTALLCGTAAICSPYSHISVVWHVRRGNWNLVINA